MIRNRSSSSRSTDRVGARRGTALFELIVILIPLLSLAIVSLAVLGAHRKAAELGVAVHRDIFEAATGGSVPGSLPDDFPMTELRPAQLGLLPASPSDLSLVGMSNSTINSFRRVTVHPAAGIFGAFGPYTVDRHAGCLREAWTWAYGPLSYTQSAVTTAKVRGWFEDGLDASVGNVRDPLRLAD